MLFLVILFGILAVIVPGFLLSFALLGKTRMPRVEIYSIGVIFGLIFPPTLQWLEAYLIPYLHFFSYSIWLYNANVILLSLIGLVLCIKQGVFDLNSGLGMIKGSAGAGALPADLDTSSIHSVRKWIHEHGGEEGATMLEEHRKKEKELEDEHAREMALLKDSSEEERKRVSESHREEKRRLEERHLHRELSFVRDSHVGKAHTHRNKKPLLSTSNIITFLLVLLLIFTFTSRMLSFGVAPKYFEFDPYFDMVSAQYILTYGYQIPFDHAAWPSVVQGVNHRIQPLVPYLEVYWYDLANTNFHYKYLNNTLLSQVSSLYPPLVAALLVFVVFIFIKYDYGEKAAIFGATLVAAMPVIYQPFIAGEQLLEPWGIFALFFFFATYIVAIRNMKEKRYAVLAGIAFASNFLGAHYYFVPAAIIGLYIFLQGVVNLLKNKDNTDFYIMNAIVILVIIISYLLYAPYGASLTNRTPSVAGIPIIIAIPVFALVVIFLLDYIPRTDDLPRSVRKYTGRLVNINVAEKDLLITRLGILVVIVVLGLLVTFFTPLGKPVLNYLSIGEHFTTPNTPLFMTVQEYAPTGLNFNFDSAGMGSVALHLPGNLLVLGVLAIFLVISAMNVFYKNSQTSILAVSVIVVLAFAGFSEVKYLPHFAVGYAIALSVIIGEIIIIAERGLKDKIYVYATYTLIGVLAMSVFIPVLYSASAAALNPNCTTIQNSNNQIGDFLYCNTLSPSWIAATAWMRANVGPNAPRILSWWDYGDWINWFGNSNAVIRGDNSVPTYDYKVAAQYVLGPADGYNYTELAHFMDSAQAGYVLFDDQLVPKWGALDFLACVGVNETTRAFAISAGQQYGQSYVLGTSRCELSHDPSYIMIPESVLTSTGSSIGDYCSISNSTNVYIKALQFTGSFPFGTVGNTTYCMPESFLSTGAPVRLFYQNGTETNIAVSDSFFEGAVPTSNNQTFLSFMAIYMPNGPNDTITDAPSEFYQSNYYRGFFLGKLPGFTLVYPSNVTGVNYVNNTGNHIMIFKLDNFTGTLPYVVPKPSWIHNNYSIPG